MALVLYDPFQNARLKCMLENILANQCEFYGSDLKNAMDLQDADVLSAIHNAMLACEVAGEPVCHHFLRVFRYGDGGICLDWMLSRMACCLVVMNADSSHPGVARVQIQMTKSEFIPFTIGR